MSIPRDKALLALKEHVQDDDIVVAVYQTNFDWMVLNPRPLNYVAVGAMGQASSHGLGLALANPDRRVFVFDGDGSLLMNLGSLVTIAGAGVQNLHHFVFHNHIYEVNGAQPLPNTNVDFAGMARAAGYPISIAYDALQDFKADLPDIVSRRGPQFVELDIVPGAAHPRDYNYIHSAEARQSFQDALNGRTHGRSA